MCEVASILRSCEPTAPGLTSMFLIDVNDIVSIPMADDDWLIEDDILLKPYKYWKQIIFREQKADLIDEMIDAIGGGFKKALGLFIPRYGNRSNKWIYNMVGTRFIMLIRDFNDQTILVGDLFSPMRMEKATGTTGKKLGDDNGWTVNIIAETTRPAYLYTGEIITGDNIPPVIINNALLINDLPMFLNTGNGEPLLYN